LPVVDAVALAVPSYSGLSIDAELGWDIIIVTFITCTLANTIDVVLNEFLGTYRSELRWMVVKA
jgi:putative effector of murein hydrolase